MLPNLVLYKIKDKTKQHALLEGVVAEKTSKNNERKQQWNSVSMKQKDKKS